MSGVLKASYFLTDHLQEMDQDGIMKKIDVTGEVGNEVWPHRLYRELSTDTYLECSAYCGLEYRADINCHFLAHSNATKMCYLGNLMLEQTEISISGNIGTYTVAIQGCKQLCS